MRKLCFAIIGAVAFASFASAADAPAAPRKGPVVETAPALFNWTSFYGGVNVGYGTGNAQGSIGSASTFGPFAADFDPKGWSYGGQIGARRQIESWVFGAEVALNWSDLDGSGAVSNAPGYSVSYNEKLHGTGLITAGYVFPLAPRWLPYAAGGISCTRGNLAIASKSVNRSSQDETNCGWAVGAGVDYAIASNASIGLRYLYSDYGDSNPNFLIGASAPGVSAGVPLALTNHRISLNANLLW